MYRRIVLAYDGTRAGREALRQGTDLAILCKAQVCLLAVVAPELEVVEAFDDSARGAGGFGSTGSS